MKIKVASPRGFCAGVDRAIDIVDRALDIFGPPIYVRHEIVHNKFIVEDMRQRGVIFVDELYEVPDNAIVIFSAHGVSRVVQQEAAQRGLRVFDATCPLVTKVHLEVTNFGRKGHECVLIGHPGHPEVEGTMGQYDRSNGGNIYLVENEEDVAKLKINKPGQLAYVTQTTLSMTDTAKVIHALKQRFPAIKGPRKDDICYATQNRQDAVKRLAAECDLMLIIGSPNSSNSNRLRELAERMGTESRLIDSANDLQPNWLDGKSVIGVSAGASAPETLIQELIACLKQFGAEVVEEMAGEVETLRFSIPKELQIITEMGDADR